MTYEERIEWAKAVEDASWEIFYYQGWNEMAWGLLDWATAILESVTPEMCNEFWKAQGVS